MPKYSIPNHMHKRDTDTSTASQRATRRARQAAFAFRDHERMRRIYAVQDAEVREIRESQRRVMFRELYEL